jgi:hypothetical protein
MIMKNTTCLLIVGAFALASCGTGRGISPGATDGVKYKMLEVNIKSMPFSAGAAEEEIQALIGDHNLTTWRTKWALGGEFRNIHDFFPKSETDTCTGTIMWFTLDSVNSPPADNRPLVLACERWDRRDRRKKPRASTLVAPDEIFTFAGDRRNFKLDEHSMLSKRPVDRSMPNKEARRRMKLYNKKVRRHLHIDRRVDYNKDCGAFFQNNLERKGDEAGVLTRFVNQEGAVGMRYYFALDPNEGRNRIRIFLVATDKNGNNLLQSTGARRTAPLIIQKSIPPNTP